MPKKGKGAVTPTYAGSSNPITKPDSRTAGLKSQCAARASRDHGDIIRNPPPPDQEETRRSKNDSASREIRKKHNNGDIITGENQAFTNFGKGRYDSEIDVIALGAENRTQAPS